MITNPNSASGILLVNKPRGKTSFNLVATLRKRLGVKKIGHAGTLDPFATGVMVMLVGREYTRLSDQFLGADKEYVAQVHLGISTDSYDCDGAITAESDTIPTMDQIIHHIAAFQGEVEQVPPMYSAKKINGQKLYELARKGKTVERAAVKVKLNTTVMSYQYPYLTLHVTCSKGTYIRSIANDLGNLLGCGGHLTQLQRTRSGTYKIEACVDGDKLLSPEIDIIGNLIK